MENQAVESKIVWVDIPCVDLDRAIAFYAAVLGCAVSKEEGPGFAMGVLPHGGSGVGGCLAVLKDTAPSDKGPLIYMNCEGRLDPAIAAVGSNGGQILQPKQPIGPHGFRAIVKDSEGNRIALHSMTA